VGISVSRVGGNAQVKAMKKIAGTLKVDQAQYRELEAFSKFGSDLDASTLAILNKGAKNVEILKQRQYAPVPIEKQIAIIYCGTMGLLKDVPIDKVKSFESEYLEFLDLKHRDILDSLRDGILNNDITKVLEKVASELVMKYRPQ
jgi:F-type H+-transporting ATPase subunit alpha